MRAVSILSASAVVLLLSAAGGISQVRTSPGLQVIRPSDTTLTERVNALQTQVNQLSAQVQSLNDQIRPLSQMGQLQAQVNQLSAQVQSLNTQVAQASKSAGEANFKSGTAIAWINANGDKALNAANWVGEHGAGVMSVVASYPYHKHSYYYEGTRYTNHMDCGGQPCSQITGNEPHTGSTSTPQ